MALKTYGWQSRDRCASDGDEMVSTGQRVDEQTARESTDVISEKPIDANASNDEVFALAA